MNPATHVIVKPSLEDFWIEGYLMMNPDIERLVRDGGSAQSHFENYGVNEGRRQVTPEYMGWRRSEGVKEKYARFRHVLEGDPKAIRHLDQAGAFPVALTDNHYSRDDYSADSANGAMPSFMEEVEANPHKLYMDLGSGLRTKVYPNVLYVEVYPTLTTDVIVSASCPYSFKSGSFDGITCAAVLEHVREPWLVAREIHRMLKVGGRAFIDYPFLQPVHGYPSHYFNATREGVLSLFEDGFKTLKLETPAYGRPDATIFWVLAGMLHRMSPEKAAKFGSLTVAEVAALPVQGDIWEELLDGLGDEAISEFSCVNTLIAEKIESESRPQSTFGQRLRRAWNAF